uniref:Uncharacterized protein n=1 Tax=Romanomermis culicivorax TaxID=13658 RepID=A0A915HJN5_ROMCU
MSGNASGQTRIEKNFQWQFHPKWQLDHPKCSDQHWPCNGLSHPSTKQTVMIGTCPVPLESDRKGNKDRKLGHQKVIKTFLMKMPILYQISIGDDAREFSTVQQLPTAVSKACKTLDATKAEIESVQDHKKESEEEQWKKISESSYLENREERINEPKKEVQSK